MNAKRNKGRKPEATETSAAQVLALRIWEGQSPDLPTNERVLRIVAGLAAQGHDMAGIELPAADYGKYL